jgi:membrane-associated phospholipid phosphatase
MTAIRRTDSETIVHAGRPARRLDTRLVLAVAIALPAALLFGLLIVAVESSWHVFRDVDRDTAQNLHRFAVEHPAWTHTMLDVSSFGGPTVFRLLIAVLVVVLWLQHARRLALWAAVTMLAGAALDLGIKTAVDRTRPVLPDPVAHAPEASFPSGHALTATLGCGILLLVALPLVGSAWGRAALWVAAILVAGAVGYSRVALGVHWVTDVVGGWLLAVGLLAATTSAFETWRAEHGLRPVKPATEGVAPEESAEAVQPNHPDA